MIDLVTGEVTLLRDSVVLHPNMSLAEVMGGPLAKYARKCATFSERFETDIALQPLDLAGTTFYWTLRFKPERLTLIDLLATLEPPAPTWSWIYRLQRRVFFPPVLRAEQANSIHDRWLREALGQTSEVGIYYPWGKISSVHDRLRQGSWICIEYVP
jgi:hypothetical protein